MKKINLGDVFTTNMNLMFKGYFIPKGTEFEVIEILEDGEFKVYFDCEDDSHLENIQIFDRKELKEISK